MSFVAFAWRVYERTMKTKVKKPTEIVREWYLVDAKGRTLGRLCSRIASVLIGKHKPTYTPHLDCGDFVVVVNADKFRVTGKKLTDKIYYTHSTYPGGLKALSLEQVCGKDPKRVIYHGVSGMLPKNRLRSKRLTRLKLLCSDSHSFKGMTFKPLNA